MTNIFTVKLLKNGQLIQQRQVHTGLAENSGAVRIKAQADTVYVLTEENIKKAVVKISTKRVGDDLQVILDESASGKPHLIIEDYFSAALSNGALATTNNDGELVMYGADNPMLASLATQPEQVVTQTAKGAQNGWWQSAGAQLALIGGGLAIIANTKGKSGSSDTNQSDKDIVTAYATATDTTRVTTPTLANYVGAGIKGVDSSNIDAVNGAINRARVKDLAGVQSVLTAYQKLFVKANGSGADNTTDDPSLADYQTLNIKLSAETIDNKFHQIDLLNDIIKNRTSTDINTVAKLDALASIADRIVQNARGNPPATQLTTAELKSIGLTDVTDANLASIISAITASADDGSGVKSITQLTSIQAAYIKVLGEADGIKLNTTDPNKTPTATEFLTLGVTLGKAGVSTDPQQANALKLLNEVIDGVSTTAVDTVAEINALASTVDKLMRIATASDTAQANSVGLDAAAITGLGITGVTPDNLAQVVESIRSTESVDGLKINSIKQLQSAVDLGIIMNYAQSANGSTAHVAPTLTQYLSAGLLSTDNASNKGINSINLAAINTAVEAKQAKDVSSLSALQGIVNTYGKLVDAADGVKGNYKGAALTTDDYKLLGALSNFDPISGEAGAGSTTSKALGTDQNVAALNLLNDAMDALNFGSQQINSIAKINLISQAVDKVLDQAKNSPPTTLKVEDFGLLGISGVTKDNLSKVVADLHTEGTNKADGTTIDGLSEIQAQVSLAQAQIYADSSSNPALTLQNYKDFNFDGIDWAGTTGLVSAVNTVLDSKTSANILVLDDVKKISLSFQSILNEATNGVSNANTDPTALTYDTILGSSNSHLFHGAPTVSDPANLASNALLLMNEVVQHKTPGALSSLNAVDSLAKQVDALMNLAGGASGTITFTDLSNMGFNTKGMSDIGYSSNLSKFWKSVADTDNSGVAINTWDEVQALINASLVLP
jgi:hypothetical protein